MIWISPWKSKLCVLVLPNLFWFGISNSFSMILVLWKDWVPVLSIFFEQPGVALAGSCWINYAVYYPFVQRNSWGKMPRGNKCPEPKIYQHATFQMSTGEHSVPDPFSLSLVEIYKKKDFIKFSKLSYWVECSGALGYQRFTLTISLGILTFCINGKWPTIYFNDKGRG